MSQCYPHLLKICIPCTLLDVQFLRLNYATKCTFSRPISQSNYADAMHHTGTIPKLSAAVRCKFELVNTADHKYRNPESKQTINLTREFCFSFRVVTLIGLCMNMRCRTRYTVSRQDTTKVNQTTETSYTWASYRWSRLHCIPTKHNFWTTMTLLAHLSVPHRTRTRTR